MVVRRGEVRKFSADQEQCGPQGYLNEVCHERIQYSTYDNPHILPEAEAEMAEFFLAADKGDRRTQGQRVNEDGADHGGGYKRKGSEQQNGASVLHASTRAA